MKTFDATLLQDLTAEQHFPSLSIFVPVHNKLPESQQDRLTLKNLIKHIRSSTTLDSEAVKELLAPVEKLSEEIELERGHQGTLAIYTNAKKLETVFLTEVYPSTFYIDDTFYIVPLLELVDNDHPFHLLAIGKNHVRFFSGNRFTLEEVDLEGKMPTTMKQALGNDLTDNHLHAAASGSATIHGYMEISDEKETDNIRFFRRIDREIAENFTKDDKRPLLLAALPENQSLFQSISKNECLLKNGIVLNIEAIDKIELHTKALSILDDLKKTALEKQLNRYAVGKNEKISSDNIDDIATSAMDRRIDRLFLEKGKQLPGTVSIEERKIKPDKDSKSDIINKIAILTYRNGGKIHTLTNFTGKLPQGIGALNRY
ncbi:baeRF6 domain-containing protein [Sphingobacterium sp. LRF_L2]|uniref:baeRF6 domain-containing protein n=1 Tax=Sphingobacterium sp. LRF_L2 TaxID=3369421 RepID=UPI003F6062AA